MKKGEHSSHLKGIEMVRIEEAGFWMGASRQDRFATRHERPRHFVRLPVFLMSVYPIERGLFWRVCPSVKPPLATEDDLPMVDVSWNEANAFCQALSAQSSHPVCLPSEEQWEYVCRAGSQRPFPTGDQLLPEDANFYYDEEGTRVGVGRLLPVKAARPNALGVCGMLGNIAQWTRCAWTTDYQQDSLKDRPFKVVRGGGWDAMPRLLRSSHREPARPESRRDNLGFRIVLEPND